MLFSETVAVYYDIHINALCWKIDSFLMLKSAVHIVTSVLYQANAWILYF
jgi:hypothetical protein